MNVYLAEKLKSLRAEKRVSQEKLAQYLNVSFQAVSKWETGTAYPDITLLPDIARYFGVSVDELLCVERIDEDRLFDEFSRKAEELHRCGKRPEVLALWQEAYQRMPNNIDVQEMLMSAYFDCDRVKYFREFHDLATNIYSSDSEGAACAMHYKSQAISQLARVFAERGEMEEARSWARKSVPVFNSMEIIEAMIDHGNDLLGDVAFCTYWFLEELFYFVCRIDQDGSICCGSDYKQNCLMTVASIYETVYQNDDIDFEQLTHLSSLHQLIAEHEAEKGGDEETVKRHLKRAADCFIKSLNVKEHRLTHPLLYGWKVSGTPGDTRDILHGMAQRLEDQAWDPYRDSDWFAEICLQIRMPRVE